ncbi:hypothetical protein JQ625_06985 [Bradyrhizobium diazoefficiens]|nr:hypothetical protein [Bradyrhizobium diazoefficiens]MBR0774569.1 hypothetical protein [Bradyrhizobium diazoefficiens]
MLAADLRIVISTVGTNTQNNLIALSTEDRYGACIEPMFELLVHPLRCIRDFARRHGSALEQGGIRLGAVLNGQFWTIRLAARHKTVHQLM